MTNSTDANYRVKDWVGFYAGYRYTDRLVRTIEGFSLPAFANSADSALYENSNHLQAGTVGVRLRPVKNLTANLEGEVGRADNPLTPVSDRNYHTLNGRVSYRTRKVQLSTSYKQVYNVNAPPGFFAAYSSHSRNYSANASWAPKDWFALDAGYMKLHLDTVTGIAYFAGTRTLQEGNSLYLSNVHAGNFGMRLAAKRADVYLGYTITKDTGGGRGVRLGDFSPSNSAANLLASVQTFPLAYQSPLGRVSVRITPKLRWNVGWQFYNYHEEFGVLGYYQNFHAHTGYTSVSWAF